MAGFIRCRQMMMCQMTLFLPLVMLTAGVAGITDLSGKMFTFPQNTDVAHVRLFTSKQDFGEVTVCLRSFTERGRNHGFFSLATPSAANDFLIIWSETKQEFKPNVRDVRADFGREDYESNVWHSICLTWDSTSGLTQLWLDGKPSPRKYTSSGSNITGNPIILLGQDQDSYGGGFSTDQSFVGMMSDVHMWDYVLSPCEIQNYMNDLNVTPGNVLNWRALDFQIVDRVLLENKQQTCY
ncbi:C-reactive protein-like [Aulostomus maculatus]